MPDDQRWKRLKEKYDKRLVSQASEDMIARRILKGCGFREKDIWKLEKTLLGQTSDESTLYDRVLAIWQRLCKWELPYYPETVEIGIKCEQELIDRLSTTENITDVRQYPIFFARHTTCNYCSAYIALPYHDVPEIMTPPFTVIGTLTNDHDMWFCGQELTEFIASFGPYYVEGSSDE